MLSRGTTPTFTFTFPNEVDLTKAENVYVTFSFKDSRIIFTKTGDDIEVEEHSVSVYLSQRETLSFPKTVRIQINWTYAEGSRIKRACSNEVVIDTERNLLNGVIE